MIHHSQVFCLSQTRVLKCCLCGRNKHFYWKKPDVKKQKQCRCLDVYMWPCLVVGSYFFGLQHTTHGHNQLLLDLLNVVNTSQGKLKLFQQQLSTGSMMHCESIIFIYK